MRYDERGQLGDQHIPDDAFCLVRYRPEGSIVECNWRDPLPPEPVDRQHLRELRPTAPSLPREHKKSYPSYRFWPNTGLHDVRALAAGDGRSCAITADGQVSCWGQSYSGATDWSHRIAVPIAGLDEVITVAICTKKDDANGDGASTVGAENCHKDANDGETRCNVQFFQALTEAKRTLEGYGFSAR